MAITTGTAHHDPRPYSTRMSREELSGPLVPGGTLRHPPCRVRCIRPGDPELELGFGARGTAFDLDLAAPGIKGAGSNRIDMVSLESDAAHRLWWDFDHPGDATLNRLGSSDPLPTEYMSIGGDSGGGVFVADSLGYVVVALMGSGGSYPLPHQQPRVHGYYGSFGYEVSITSVNRWLDSLTAGR